MNIILKMHKSLPVELNKLNRRRKNVVAHKERIRTVFAERQYSGQSIFIYNKINKTLNIYNKKTYECKEILENWLKTLTYEETENLLKRII